MRFGAPLAAALLAVPTLSAQTPRTLPADFDAEVAWAMCQFEVPGLAIAVVKDGHMVFAMSPLLDFGFDYQDLLFTPVPPARRPSGPLGLPGVRLAEHRRQRVARVLGAYHGIE